MNSPHDQIEILSVDLLDHHRPQVDDLRSLARSLGLDFGWHYLLDLTWIIDHLGPVTGRQIIDAGAGTGVLQWYLAEHGAQVISVDRAERSALPLRFRTRYQVRGMRPSDLHSTSRAFAANLRQRKSWRAKVSYGARDLLSTARSTRSKGDVVIYNQDLKNLVDIPDASIDAVVAVSALEHNTPEGLQQVVAELMRVLRPGGVLLASLNAAPEQDWYHEASSGWCYSADSLRRLFSLSPDTSDNYDQYERLLQELRDCRELKDNLARFYFASGDNGMPWGQWDPQYVPVGVQKVKPTR